MAVSKTILARSGVEVSRVGLGLAHVHTMSRIEDRERLIRCALDLGITHFDTSRFYSDGLSETTLGRILGDRRRSLTIATKFGLLPTPLIGSAGFAAPPLRKFRSLLNKLRLVSYPRRSYTRETFRRSLRDSLRALRTDYIDIYMLHEPLDDTRPDDDLFEELIRSRKDGVVRAIGVSGATIDPMVSRYGGLLDVVQTAEGTWSEDRFVPDITHSLFANSLGGGTMASNEHSVRHLLEKALARRPQGAVIVQTRTPSHLEQIAEWSAGK